MKRNPKRTLTAGFLALAMLLSLLPTAAFASEAEEKTAVETLSEEGYQLNDTASGTCGDNLTWTLEDGTLTISGTGDMTDYGHDYAPWYDSGKSIASVVIGDGVTSIGDYAFYCVHLTGITIPDSVTSIGNSAFYACANLTDITIPDGVTCIDNFAFCYCNSLTSVTIGSSVTSIGIWAFEDCIALTSITIPDSVTSIGEWAFEGCKALTGVTLGSGVATIGDSAFSGCTGLTDVYYSGSEDDWNAISIGSDNDCLTSATIHYNCTGTCGDNLTWTLENGVLTISGTGDMTGYNPGDAPWYDLREWITSVVIADGVTSIGGSAFCDCENLTNVTIPEGVTYIGDYAFYGCTGLASVTIPEGVTYVGEDAFFDTALYADETNWKDGVLYLGSYLCEANPDILEGSYAVEEGTTLIAASAFAGCTGLTSVTIPDTVTIIGGFAFEECTGLTSAAIGNGVTSIGGYAFWNCDSLTDVTIGNSVASIGYFAFQDCASLTSVTIGSGVESIYNGAFLGCDALTDVYYSGSETDWAVISIDAGNDCLTSATIHYNSNDSAATFLFSDVTNDESWYYDAVYWAYDLGITEGYSDGTFRPNNNCTRAEFTTFLYQLANAYGLENAGETTSTSFTDVAEGSWYYTYVMWAAENGLVSGYSDGTFRPNNQITRAEAVTMLYGFYKSFVNGGQEPTVSAGESGFSDLSEDSWYYTYMLWATQNGVVSGYDDGTCRPNTNCTRSVMVVLLYATANHLL